MKTDFDVNRTYPGPQVKMRSFNKITSILSILLIASIFMLIYSVFQENQNNLVDSIHPFFKNKLLDSRTSSTIFVTILGFILVRHHFLVGLRPRIVYETKKTKKSVFDNTNLTDSIWQVKIKNNGLGAAILKEYKFRLSFESVTDSDYEIDQSQTLKILEEHNIHLEVDYCLLNLTNGYTIPSKEEIVIFEMVVPVAINIKQFDLHLEFNGFVSGKFAKDIYLLPRNGIPVAAISQFKG